MRTADGQPRELISWREVMSEMRQPQVLFFLAAQLFANLTRGSVQGILLLYVAFTYDKGPGTLGIMQAGSAFVVIPMTFTTGIIMDRFGRKKTVVPGFLIMALAAFGLGLGSQMGASFLIFVALYYLLASSQGMTAGNMQVLGSDLAPERMRGRFFSFQRLAGEFGGAMSPTMFSLLSAISYFVAFGWVSFCGVAVATIIALKVRDVVGDERRARGAAGQGATAPTTPTTSGPQT